MQLPDIARPLEARATRLETPCGDGSLVWHSWGSGAPIVLLHGGSGSWTHWIRNIDALVASGRKVLVPDMPGFGDSALPPAGVDADALPEPIEAGLKELLGLASCEMAGFSFGGMVAGFIAERFPRRVSRLVVIGAPGMGLWAGRKTLDLAPWRHLPDAAERAKIHRNNLALLMLHHEASLTDDTVALQQYNVERDRTRGRSIARTDALAQAIRQLSCPVSAIYGSHDVLYRNRMDELRGLLEGMPSFRRFVEIPDAGHWVQYEAADAFNEALLNVLDD
ncbi:MAG: alpha/beta hydrolase [Comamonadaceae bacterium]|nr:MAG: alpha/beta hydrolase [Comamonadaceae bacterium]